MTNSRIAKIEYCFPKFSGKSKGILINTLIRNIQLNKEIGYAGYFSKAELRDDISWRFTNSDVNKYRFLSDSEQKRIEEVILLTLQKCVSKLPAPKLPIFVFVFPWLGPFDEYDDIMGHVTGFAPHKNTFHIFLSPDTFSAKSLGHAVAHEFNHAVFFHYHPLLDPDTPSSKPTIRDVLIWEGLAENFVEEVTKVRSPISSHLNKSECEKALDSIRSLLTIELDEKNNIYEALFFGGDEYKKWTGYSVGYWLVKNFIENNPHLSWDDLIRINSVDFLNNKKGELSMK